MRGAKIGQNRYKFENVKIAEADLAINKSSSKWLPRILVLNNKLNKCQTTSANSAVVAANESRCVSCCLRIEEPEFRRRSSVETPDYQAETGQCFGKLLAPISLSIMIQQSS